MNRPRRIISFTALCLLAVFSTACGLPSPVARLIAAETPTPTTTPLPLLTLAPCPYSDMCPGALIVDDLIPGNFEPGVVNNVDVPYDQPISFYTAWIAKDNTILAENLEHMQFYVKIDGINYWDDSFMGTPEPYVFEEEPNTEYASQWAGVELLVGRSGNLKRSASVSPSPSRFNDGWKTYASGTVFEDVYDMNPILPPQETPTPSTNLTPAVATLLPFAPTEESSLTFIPFVRIVAHESMPSSGQELWLEFPFNPGDVLPGSQIESYLNNGSLELTLPNGEAKTISQVPHSPVDSEVTSDIWLPGNTGIQKSPAPAGMLPLNGMSFENYNESPSGPQIRIHRESLPDLSSIGQYKISWKSGDLISNVVVFGWDGKKITVREP